jgi:hypothetical protein
MCHLCLFEAKRPILLAKRPTLLAKHIGDGGCYRPNGVLPDALGVVGPGATVRL